MGHSSVEVTEEYLKDFNARSAKQEQDNLNSSQLCFYSSRAEQTLTTTFTMTLNLDNNAVDVLNF